MKKTRSVTYGAMIVGIISLALFLDRAFAGAMSPALSLPIAIPIIIFSVMYGVRDGFVVYVVSVIVSFLFSGMLPSMLMVVGYGGIGLIYAYAYNKQLSNKARYILMTIGLVLFYWIMIRFFSAYFGFSISEWVDLFERLAPNLGKTLFLGLAYGMAATTMIMELFLIEIIAKFMIVRLRLNIEKNQ